MGLHESETSFYISCYPVFSHSHEFSDSVLILIWLHLFSDTGCIVHAFFNQISDLQLIPWPKTRKCFYFLLTYQVIQLTHFQGICNILWEQSFIMDLFNIMLICSIDSYFQEQSCTSAEQFCSCSFLFVVLNNHHNVSKDKEALYCKLQIQNIWYYRQGKKFIKNNMWSLLFFQTKLSLAEVETSCNDR